MEINQKQYDEATDIYISTPEIEIEDQNEELGYVKLSLPKELEHKGEILTAKQLAEKLKPLFQEKIFYKVIE